MRCTNTMTLYLLQYETLGMRLAANTMPSSTREFACDLDKPFAVTQRSWALQVHDATSKLTATPSSPEDFAELLGFLQKLEERRRGLDETYDHVGAPVM